MSRTLPYALPVLRTTPQRWIRLAETIPPELFRRAPAPGEWSAHDCLRHIVDTERLVFPARVGHLLRGEDFPAFDPGAGDPAPDAPPDAFELATAFARLRDESLELLAGLRPEDLARSARHSELGAVTLEEMLNEWAGHDLMHTVQAERALLQPFIEACGPWRRYFADHIIPNKAAGKA
jgi:uncharacterized damage-inducible protein DinB